MITLLVFAAVSIGFSFLCSILEAVLLSVTPAYIRTSEASGSKTGTLLNAYKEDIDRPLSAILTLNTIAHTVGAMGVGAIAGKLYGSPDHSIFGISYESIIAGVMTLAILILSEIIPKTIGANNWKALTPFTVRTLQILLFLLAPLVWVSQLITKKLKKDKEKSVLSRSDFAAMTNVAAESGGIQKAESKIITNLLNFEKMRVRDIMSPKTVAFMANEEETISDFYNNNKSMGFSRIPVYADQTDNITGIVLKDEILEKMAEDKHTTKLKDIKKPVKFITDQTELPDLFSNLTKERQHLMVVVDEFGNVIGLVSQEDLFETLLGEEIIDETDTVKDLQQLAKEKWAAKQKEK